LEAAMSIGKGIIFDQTEMRAGMWSNSSSYSCGFIIQLFVFSGHRDMW
jgi:hypothetical protein